MTQTTFIANPVTEPAQPRAKGELRLKAVQANGQSRIAGLRQSGSLKMLFPTARGTALDAVVLNTAGGLTGGDQMRIRCEAGPAAHLVLSTQAAERGYRARTGTTARVQTDLAVGTQGRLDWLPQETILYDGASLQRRLTVNLAPEGRALVVEPVILGRVAMGEVVGALDLTDRWSVLQDGRMVFADVLRLSGDATRHMARLGAGGGAGAYASVLYAGPDAAGFLGAVRDLLPPTAGASLVRDGILFIRLLARDGFSLRRDLIPVIERLSIVPLPKVWRL